MVQDPSAGPEPDTGSGKERRRHRRFSVSWAGKILGMVPTECVVLNISAGGLKLRLPRETRLPDRFVIALPPRGQFAAELLSLEGRIARVRLLADEQAVAKAVADALPTALFLERSS